jgi:hypothetical protein
VFQSKYSSNLGRREYNGANLYNHEQQYKFNYQRRFQTLPSRGSRLRNSLEECKFRHHNSLKGLKFFYHKSPSTLCHARFVAKSIACSHILGGRSICYESVCTTKTNLKSRTTWSLMPIGNSTAIQRDVKLKYWKKRGVFNSVEIDKGSAGDYIIPLCKICSWGTISTKTREFWFT